MYESFYRDPPPPARRTSANVGTAPPRAFPLPPELLTQVIILSTHRVEYSDDSADDYLVERNRQLSALALVSSDFQRAAYSVLYGDLRLAWLARSVQRLTRSFEDNTALLPLVRSLEVSSVDRRDWCADQAHFEEDLEKSMRIGSFYDMLYAYCNEMGISDSDVEEALEYGSGTPIDEVVELWHEERYDEREEIWYAHGNDRWEHLPLIISFGAGELLDLLDKTPNLRALVVHGFTFGDPESLKVYGPFEMIQSLKAPDDYPFTQNPACLASFLASRTPHLRHLSGYLNDYDTSHPTKLPSLSSLKVNIRSFSEAQLTALLQQVAPSLRHLTLASAEQHSTPSGAVLAPFISTLESLDISEIFGEIMAPDLLARAIADSSLLHLRLCANARSGRLPPSELVTSLPPTLLTLDFVRGQLEDLVKILAMLKTAAPRPRTVHFTTECMQLESLRREYAAEWEAEDISLLFRAIPYAHT